MSTVVGSVQMIAYLLFQHPANSIIQRHTNSLIRLTVSPDGEYQKWDGKAWVKDEEAETAA